MTTERERPSSTIEELIDAALDLRDEEAFMFYAEALSDLQELTGMGAEL